MWCENHVHRILGYSLDNRNCQSRSVHVNIAHVFFEKTLQYQCFFCVSDVMEAAEKSQAQHRLEKQRCEEMDFRVHKIEEELEELKSDNKRLEPVSMFTVTVTLLMFW